MILHHAGNENQIADVALQPDTNGKDTSSINDEIPLLAIHKHTHEEHTIRR